MGKLTVKCAHCRQPFQARQVDRDRGWAKFCSKSCKAKRQTADRVKNYELSKWERDQQEHEEIMFESTTSHGQDGTGGV